MLEEPNLKELIENLKSVYSLRNGHSYKQFIRQFYLLEHKLNLLRKRQKYVLKIDPTIFSKNILNSFEILDFNSFFRPVDYQFNFLNYLAKYYNPSKKLIDYIDGFIEIFKEQLNYPDIVITDTGSTRCKTNIRFAVNGLRNIGLLLEKDNNNYRAWSPTIFGLIVLLYILFFENRFKDYRYYKSKSILGLINDNKKYYSHYFKYDAFLIKVIEELQEYTYFIQFLTVLQNCGIKISKFEIIKSLLNGYKSVLFNNLIITEKGIKETKNLKKDILNYLHNLDKNTDYLTLYSELFRIYREYLNE